VSSGTTGNRASRNDGRHEQESGDLPLQFARAIAKPGSLALLIDADNRPLGRCSIEEAASNGRAYAVEVAEDIFASDADTPETAQYLENKLLPLLEESRVEPVLVASGGTGRRHLLARIDDPELLRVFVTLSRRSGCDVRRVIRAPLAPLRLGHRTEILHPRDPADALRRLKPRPSTSSTRPRNVRHNRNLSPRIFDLIRNGDSTGRYPSRSEIVMAIALSTINANLPEESLWKMLTEENNRGGEKVQEILSNKGERAARQYVARAYAKGRAHAATTPPFRCDTDLLRAINEFELAVDLPAYADRFTGRNGSTDRAVIQGFIGVARRCGSIEFDLSLRQLCEHAGISSRQAVRASLSRLEAKELLQIIQPPKPRTMGRYRLRSLPTHSTSGGCEENGSRGFASPNHDAWWGRKALWRIWRLLEGLTARQVAERARIRCRGVEQQLKQLREWGLAVRDDQHRYHRIEQVEVLQNLAELRGTAGRIACLRDRHRSERENRRESQCPSRRLKAVPDPTEVGTRTTPQLSQQTCLQRRELPPLNEVQRIANLDAERAARDKEMGRGYDFDPSSPSHREFLERLVGRRQEPLAEANSQAPRPKVDSEVAAEISRIETQAQRLGWPNQRLWGSAYWPVEARGLAAVLDRGDRIAEVTDEYLVIEKSDMRRTYQRFFRCWFDSDPAAQEHAASRHTRLPFGSSRPSATH
jgi:hypothetical protein